MQRRAGVQTTTPLRTAFDIARRPPLSGAVVALDAMLAADLVTRAALARIGTERERWPGVCQLHKALLVCDPGAESPMESRLRLVLIAAGLPWPVTQHEVFSPRHRLGVEYEGDHHRSRSTFQRDYAGSTLCAPAAGPFSASALPTSTTARAM